MTQIITELPEYKSTIDALEGIKHTTKDGVEYWFAREIHTILGYDVWDKFEPVITKGMTALKTNGIDPSHHIAHVSNMMELGKGAKRKVNDYFLSRAACRIIAMNGAPSKPEIAAAQAYFVVQTHRAEQVDAMNDDENRLEAREKVTIATKKVADAAFNRGLRGPKFGLFHNARYEGLYGMSISHLKTHKGLSQKDNPLDYAGALELSANEFQMNMATDVIEKESITGSPALIAKNKEIAKDVRKIMTSNCVTLPESLPVEEPIKEVKKRLNTFKKTIV